MIGKKFCPNCGGDDVEMVAGGITGAWMCADCGYSGSIFPEKPIVGGKSAEYEEETEDDLDLDDEEKVEIKKVSGRKKIIKKKIIKKAKKVLKKKK